MTVYFESAFIIPGVADGFAGGANNPAMSRPAAMDRATDGLRAWLGP